MQETSTSAYVAPRVAVHYGIPSTASALAFDPVQRLLAVGTTDGRIKVIGGDNIEGLLMCPKAMPFKNLEFLQNQGFLVSVSNGNEIQVWNLESRCISSNLQWESNITAFAAIYGTQYMYVGDEYGFLSVLKYDAEEGKILQLPYHIPANLVAEEVEISLFPNQSIVGVLPQPSSSGNRVVIAYENGLIVLWDVTEDRAVHVRGHKDLQPNDDTLVEASNSKGHGHLDDLSDHEQEEKEISSLCWVSTDGSVLGVGYVDGDILLWNLSVSDSSKGQTGKKLSSKVVKVQLSSGERRLPVIVLHWSPNRAKNVSGGQLFVYGGEEIGSEEVLTILDLDWSSGLGMLKCVHRVDLPLSGSFMDMVVLASSYGMEDNDTSLLVLTTPGQLQFYDNVCLSAYKSDPEKKRANLGVKYPATIPTVEPCMTVGKLYSVYTRGDYSSSMSEALLAAKNKFQHNMTSANTDWPLTGGVPAQLSASKDSVIRRIYIVGYVDGTARIWDATFPVLSLLHVLKVEAPVDGQVEDIKIAGASASISAIEYSSTELALAIGTEFGLVFIYNLDGNCNKASFYLITQTQREVHDLPHQVEPQCIAIFSLQNSPVRSLHWSTSGDRLAVGFESGLVAILETSSPSILSLSDTSSFSSTVISLAMLILPKELNNQSEIATSDGSMKEVSFILTRDSHVYLMDNTTGKMIHQPFLLPEASTAISLCILGENATDAEGSEELSQLSSDAAEGKLPPADKAETGNRKQPHSGQQSMDSLILLCCEEAIYLYSSKSLIQDDNYCISKLNLPKPCCWTTIYKNGAKEYGLIVVYHSGEIEIRSLPDFRMLGSTSLASLLRWNFKTNMEKLMSSSDNGQITLVNGHEFAIVSLLASENDFRIPEALPCLHDEVLAAGSDAVAIRFCEDQKNKQSTIPGVFGGIIKGLKGAKKDENIAKAQETIMEHLEAIFSRVPFSDPSGNIADDLEKLELDIDDIEIDEPVSVSSSSCKSKNDDTEKNTERRKLFEGGSTDTKPRLRTREEIIAKYRKHGDATSAAAEAKNKLMERGEKLEKLSERTAELQSGAESFASMANELAKNMERRKWWNI